MAVAACTYHVVNDAATALGLVAELGQPHPARSELRIVNTIAPATHGVAS